MISALLSRMTNLDPKHVALVFGKTTWSYGELAEKIERFAWGLASLGISPGDRVALVLENSPEYVVTFLGTIAHGAIAVPLNPAYQPEELRYYFDQCQASAVVSGEKQTSACKSLLENKPEAVLISTGDEWTGVTNLQTLINGETIGRIPAVSLHTDAVYQYSSGSTGRPKRVPRTHAQLFSEGKSIAETMNLSPQDRIFCAVPLFHTHGQGNCLLAAVCSNATLVFLEHANPFSLYREHALEVLEGERVTVFPGVPFMFGLLARCTHEADLSALRLCFSAGSALPKETFDNFYHRFGIPVRQLYGCTEAGAVTINLDEDPGPSAASVGKTLQGVRIRIVDDSKTDVALGEIGEVAISAPGLTRGYAGLTEHNREVFSNGFFYSGDIGRLDAENRLWITGRKKLFIEVVGNKVDPIEVEDILITHPAVSEAVVVGVPGKLVGEEQIKAVVVANTSVNENSLKRYCFERMAAFKVPMVIEFRDEIPKSPLGKVLRKYLV